MIFSPNIKLTPIPTNIFGKENIFDITIKNMERLKRYDVTGVTFKDQFDKAVQDVYSNVTDEIFSRMAGE